MQDSNFFTINRFILNIFFCVFAGLICTEAFGQTPPQTIPRYDTIKVPRKSYMVINDSIYYFANDTVLIIPDETKYKIRKDPKEAAKVFYEDMKSRMGRRKLTKQLFDALVSMPSEDFSLDSLNKVKSRNQYRPYDGLIVGEVTLNKLTVFGPEVSDTTKEARTFFQKTFNSLHWKTSGNVIRNNFTVKPGQRVRANDLADAERILRELPFIRDARLIMIPRANSDTVDIEIVTQDVFPYSMSIEPRDVDAGILDLNHRNLFGQGYEFDNRLQYDEGKEQTFNYQGSFRIPNIRRTFTVGELKYSNTFRERGWQTRITRDFITPDIKYAGGVEINQLELRGERFIPQDTSMLFFPYSFDQQNVWLGRAFKLGFKNTEQNQRSRLIVSGRFSNIHYINRPFEIKADTNQTFHSSRFWVGSLAFTERRFFKDRLIYGYGRTEDIPIGHLVELLYGYEQREFYDRRFMGARASIGGYVGNLGYFYSQLSLESFFRENKPEQGLLFSEFQFFSNLIDLRSWKFRQFVTLNYTRGINRFEDEFVTINNRDGVRGLSSPFFRGTQRLNLNVETVAFTPLDVVGFRFAFYGFTDIGYINSSDVNILSGTVYQGVGIGLRVRNDNLTFKAFEIRFAYYPNSPAGIKPYGIDFSSSSGSRFRDFVITQPGQREFR
jgi:hypothetical protein